jgi:hypothetical protein
MTKKVLATLGISLISLMAASSAFATSLENPLSGGVIDVIYSVIDYVASMIAGLVVLMLVIGGIMFAISAGNPGRIETAKKIILYAIIGAAIALGAEGIIQLLRTIIGV